MHLDQHTCKLRHELKEKTLSISVVVCGLETENFPTMV